MTITRYRTRPTFTNQFPGLVNELLGRDLGTFFTNGNDQRSMPRVNILEHNDHFELQMLVPGFSRNDLKLHVENEVLTISGAKEKEELKENERATRREFEQRSFSRSFHLPETVNADAIKADLKDGILHLSIPKAEIARPKKHEISIN